MTSVPRLRFIRLCCLAGMLLAAGSPGPAHAQNAPSLHQEVPDSVSVGDPFLVAFSATGLESVHIRFRDREFTVRAVRREERDSRAEALLSMPLESKNSMEPLAWTAAGRGTGGAWRVSGSADVAVARKQYPVQKLTLAPKYVTPPPEVQARIEEERRRIHQALSTLSPERYWTLPLLRPVPGSLSSLFGMRRTLNGKTQSVHRGLDFRAKAGDPVAVCADGRVVLAGEFYYAGNCVIVDHGLGVLTSYMHLSVIDAHQGQMLQRGDIVGRVGSTGRSTGPHLHLGLHILGTGVNAQTVLEAPARQADLPAPSSGKRQP